MPELPDITVYVEALRRLVVGKRLEAIRLGSPFVLRSVTPTPGALAGRGVRSVERLGKRIVVGLDQDAFVVVHLMVAGRLQWKEKGVKLPGKVGLAGFDFTPGTLVLTEASTKKRASIHLVEGSEGLRAFDRGGTEVLECTVERFAQVLRSESHTLKRALTDPRLFSGIGNAYSDEILHRARLSPLALTGSLAEAEVARLFAAARQTLTAWTQRLRDEAKDQFPQKVTAFRPQMAVHGKHRAPCPVCGAAVQRIVYAENETNYCAPCQTGGRLLADRSLSRLLKSDWPRTADELEELRGAPAASSAPGERAKSGR